MGMDVFGNAPTSEAGRYFRNNVWWWHPLAEYCTIKHPDLTEGCTEWHSNDGDGLDAPGAQALAEALRADLDDGTVAAYEAEYKATLAALEPVQCRACSGTGQRGGAPCRSCNATGKTEHPDTWYPFSADNVSDFAQFLTDCGGFTIC